MLANNYQLSFGFSDFELIVFLSRHNFTVQIHDRCSHDVVFIDTATKSHFTGPEQHQRAFLCLYCCHCITSVSDFIIFSIAALKHDL